MIACANINVQAVWPTTVVSLLYLSELIWCTLPVAQDEFTATRVCVCVWVWVGGWVGVCLGVCGCVWLIFSVSAFLSLSAPLLSRALSCFVYRQKSSFLFPQIRFIQLLFSKSSPHTELAIHRTCSCGPAWHRFCLAEPAWSQRCWFVFLRQHYHDVQTFCWCSWCCCWCNMVITFPEPDFIFGRYSSLQTPCIRVPWFPSRAPCYSDVYPEQGEAKRQSRWTAMINFDL